MNEQADKQGTLLPFDMPLSDDPKAARWQKVVRVAAHVVLAAALIVPVVQIQTITMRNLRKAGEWDRRKEAGQLSQAQLEEGRPKGSKGAIARWSIAARALWRGQNIYTKPPKPGEAKDVKPDDEADVDDEDYGREIHLHPNMPFVVMLITPFAYLPISSMALVFSTLKVLVIAATIGMVASAAKHRRLRMADWVMGLALGWSVLFIVGDIQHGNTNGFVLGLVALHVWLYRKGRDWWAGGALAMAVCIKMTPALFLLYWLYQRNWKLLGGIVLGGVTLAVVIPAAALGPGHYAELTGTWLENLIIPGLIEGAWYPIHINQSLPGVLSRYFLDGPAGDIFWNSDDDPHYQHKQRAWITFVDLGERNVKLLTRALQTLWVGIAAWAIGWRKLPRDDGRRMLHWGLITLGMMLLNQRTWDHHAPVLLLAAAGIWYALAYGRMKPRTRQIALAIMLLAGPLLWLGGTSTFDLAAKLAGESDETGELWADYAKAYGPTFWYFVLLTAVSVILLRALKGKDSPYSPQRQPVFPKNATDA
jgi:hypothetical protein